MRWDQRRFLPAGPSGWALSPLNFLSSVKLQFLTQLKASISPLRHPHQRLRVSVDSHAVSLGEGCGQL